MAKARRIGSRINSDVSRRAMAQRRAGENIAGVPFFSCVCSSVMAASSVGTSPSSAASSRWAMKVSSSVSLPDSATR